MPERNLSVDEWQQKLVTNFSEAIIPKFSVTTKFFREKMWKLEMPQNLRDRPSLIVPTDIFYAAHKQINKGEIDIEGTSGLKKIGLGMVRKVRLGSDDLRLSADAQQWGSEKILAIEKLIEEDVETHKKDICLILENGMSRFEAANNYLELWGEFALLRNDLLAIAKKLDKHLDPIMTSYNVDSIMR